MRLISNKGLRLYVKLGEVSLRGMVVIEATHCRHIKNKAGELTLNPEVKLVVGSNVKCKRGGADIKSTLMLARRFR